MRMKFTPSPALPPLRGRERAGGEEEA